MGGYQVVAMQTKNNNSTHSRQVLSRDKCSHSLGSIAMGLSLLGPCCFGLGWFMAQQSGSIYDARNWEPAIQMALYLPACAFCFATASLIARVNQSAAIIIAASVLFDYIAVLFFIHLTD